MAERKATLKGSRSWVGTMLVAWTFVSGSAIVMASAWYHRTKNIEFLIVWLAPPFVIGCLLFLVVAVVSFAGNVREKEVEVVLHKGTRQSIFRDR